MAAPAIRTQTHRLQSDTESVRQNEVTEGKMSPKTVRDRINKHVDELLNDLYDCRKPMTVMARETLANLKISQNFLADYIKVERYRVNKFFRDGAMAVGKEEREKIMTGLDQLSVQRQYETTKPELESS